MKKIIGFLSLAAAFTFTACAPKAEEPKKEVIVVTAPPPAPAPVVVVKERPAVVVKEPAEKNTTISLDKNGVKVVTKKIDIQVKKQ